jgi:hypothetical protein
MVSKIVTIVLLSFIFLSFFGMNTVDATSKKVSLKVHTLSCYDTTGWGSDNVYFIYAYHIGRWTPRTEVRVGERGGPWEINDGANDPSLKNRFIDSFDLNDGETIYVTVILMESDSGCGNVTHARLGKLAACLAAGGRVSEINETISNVGELCDSGFSGDSDDVPGIIHCQLTNKNGSLVRNWYPVHGAEGQGYYRLSMKPSDRHLYRFLLTNDDSKYYMYLKAEWI